MEGVSTVPLLKDPNQPWKKASFSQYARPLSGLPSIPGRPPFPKGTNESVMGYTMRTDKVGAGSKVKTEGSYTYCAPF